MSYTAKHWVKLEDFTVKDLNILELGLQEAHDDTNELDQRVANLTVDVIKNTKKLNSIVDDSSIALQAIKDIEKLLIEDPDLSSILKNYGTEFLTKTPQSLTDAELRTIYKNLHLTDYKLFNEVLINGEPVNGTVLDITYPTIDMVLNSKSNNPVSNSAVAKALEKLGDTNISQSIHLHDTSIFAHEDLRDIIANIPVVDENKLVKETTFNRVVEELRNKKVDLSGYALIDHDHDNKYSDKYHNHDDKYSFKHSHPYALDTHHHDSQYANINHEHTQYATTDFVEKTINSIPTPDVSGQINTHNSNPSAHQDIRDAIKNIDLSGYALIDHNHDGVYAPATHTHPYASEHHTHNYSYYQRDTIDLSDTSIYDENKYYPCTSKIPVNGLYKLQVAVQLNSGTKPSWSTHDSGFTYNLSALLKANDWGVTNGTMIIFEDTYSHSSVKPGSLTQLTNSGNAVLWLRGGGKYFVFKDWSENWSIHTETTDIYSQTIAPTETLPTSQGEKVSYESHTHNYLPLSGGKMTGPLTWKDGNALPRNDSPKFILTIDDFVNGGTTKWVLLNDLKAALAVPTDYATSSHNHDGVYAPATHSHSYATQSDIDNAIANLVGAAPESLDTIYELATALKNEAKILDQYALKNHNHDYLPLSGGTMSGPLVITGGDAASGVGNIQLDTDGQIIAKGTSSTLFGRVSDGGVYIGSPSYDSIFRGKQANLMYNGKALAFSETLDKYLPLAGGIVTSDIILNGTTAADKRATLQLISSGDTPNDLIFGSKGSNHWSLTSRASDMNHQLALYNYGLADYALAVYRDTNNVAIMKNLTVGGSIITNTNSTKALITDGYYSLFDLEEGGLYVGTTANYDLILRGKSYRPTYMGPSFTGELALTSDLNNYKNKYTWTCTLSGAAGWYRVCTLGNGVTELKMSHLYTGSDSTIRFGQAHFKFRMVNKSGYNGHNDNLSVLSAGYTNNANNITQARLVVKGNGLQYFELYKNDGSTYIFDVESDYAVGTKYTTAPSGDTIPEGYSIMSSKYISYSGKIVGNISSADYANKAWMLDGFNGRPTAQSWGNQTGTFIFGLDDSTGGSLAFRRDNPTYGQMSMIIDGTVYINEGNDEVATKSALSSYVPLGTVNASTVSTPNLNSRIVNIEDADIGIGQGQYIHLINLGGYTSGNFTSQIAMPYINSLSDSKMFIRTANGNTWRDWREVITTGNIATHAAPASHTHSYITSKGALEPQQNRTQALGDVYTYNTYSTYDGKMPTSYTSVIGFGRGTAGTVEIAGCWVSERGLWYRALRDCNDNWWPWKRIITEEGGTINGNLTVTGWIDAHSDERLKENIINVDDKEVKDFIENIKIKAFNYKDSGNRTVGILAQHAENLEIDGAKFTSTNEDGYLQVHENKFVYLLWNYCQQLNKRIKELEGRVK